MLNFASLVAARIAAVAASRDVRRRASGGGRAGGGGGAAAAAPAPVRSRRRSLRVRIVRHDLEDLAIDLAGLVARLVLEVNARELLQHRDGLGFLIERGERDREQAERLDVARIGLEARLELLQRAARIVAAQVQAGELAVERVVIRLVPQQALGDLDEVVLPALAAQLLARVRELRRRFFEEVFLRVQLGELDPRRDVLRIEIDQLLDRVERVLGVAFAMEVRGDRFVVLHRIAHQAEAAIELCELQDHVDETRIQFQDLLVDGHGFQEKALFVVEARDLQIGVGRFLFRALLRVEVADLQPHADVLRIFGDDP